MEHTESIILCAAIVFIGGVVKGVIGLGLPLISVSLMSIILPVKTVVGLLAVPILLSNIWQAQRAGGMLQPLKRFWPMMLAASGGLLVGVYLLVALDPRGLYALVGGSVIVICSVMLADWAPRIRPEQERPVGLLFGAVAGVIGGLSTVWAPPLSIYLLMLDVRKEEFIRITGALFFIAAVPVFLLYALNGIVNADNVLWSASLTIPAFLGMAAGQKMRNAIPQNTFRKMLLVVLILLGCVLMYRSFA